MVVPQENHRRRRKIEIGLIAGDGGDDFRVSDLPLDHLHDRVVIESSCLAARQQGRAEKDGHQQQWAPNRTEAHTTPPFKCAVRVRKKHPGRSAAAKQAVEQRLRVL